MPSDKLEATLSQMLLSASRDNNDIVLGGLIVSVCADRRSAAVGGIIKAEDLAGQGGGLNIEEDLASHVVSYAGECYSGTDVTGADYGDAGCLARSLEGQVEVIAKVSSWLQAEYRLQKKRKASSRRKSRNKSEVSQLPQIGPTSPSACPSHEG